VLIAQHPWPATARPADSSPSPTLTAEHLEVAAIPVVVLLVSRPPPIPLLRWKSLPLPLPETLCQPSPLLFNAVASGRAPSAQGPLHGLAEGVSAATRPRFPRRICHAGKFAHIATRSHRDRLPLGLRVHIDHPSAQREGVLSSRRRCGVASPSRLVRSPVDVSFGCQNRRPTRSEGGNLDSRAHAWPIRSAQDKRLPYSV